MISLGKYCFIAKNIKIYVNNNVPTNFFDWVRTDFKCVLYILKLKNIESTFNIENLNIDKETFKHQNNLTITLKHFDDENLTLLFHHDIKLDEYILNPNDNLIEFINKYKRRHERLINLINTNSKLYFICYIINIYEFDLNDFNIFDEILKSINKNINYKLIVLVEDNDKTYTYVLYENYVKINIIKYLKKDVNSKDFDWIKSQYDWKSIFELIQTI
jgi:predicted Zn-dependent protease